MVALVRLGSSKSVVSPAALLATGRGGAGRGFFHLKGREGLFPFEGERGHVADDEVELLFGDVAGEWDGVEAGAADGALAEEGVDGDVAFAPALGKAIVFEDGDHEAVVAGALDVDVADGGGESGGGGEGGGGGGGGVGGFF